MPTIRKAMKGDRRAMYALYEKERKENYAVCRFLLCDDGEAQNAVVQIFKNVYREILDGAYRNEGEFTFAMTKKALVYCKARLEKKDPKALRISDRLYDRTEYAVSGDGGLYDGVFAELPVFARFTLVLRVLYRHTPVMSDRDAAKLFGTNTATLEEAFAVETDKLSRAFASAGLPPLTEEFGEEMEKELLRSVPSAETDERATKGIAATVEPYEQERRKKTKITLISGVAVVLAVLLITAAVVIPPIVKKALDKTYYAEITIEEYGTITLLLYDDVAPITVENFVTLAESGFYDGLTFHRIMEGFMMQGGDPDGNAKGGNVDKNGKKVTITGEFSANGYENPISHVRGVVSMARSDAYDSASSQFFIVHEDSTFLDGKYAAFGRVINGMDIVDAICESAEPTDDNGKIPTEMQPVITSITIRTE